MILRYVGSSSPARDSGHKRVPEPPERMTGTAERTLILGGRFGLFR